MSSILIIGGGVIGLSLARELHKLGAEKISVVERGEIGMESSFAAAGMLSPQAEADLADDFFRFCWESKSFYPELAEELIAETGVDIELDQTGTLYLAFNPEDSTEIRERYDWQESAGLNVEHLNAVETHKLEPFVSPDAIESLLFPDDWQIENKKLIEALNIYAQTNGIEIVENTEIVDLKKRSDSVQYAVTIEGENHFADHFVITAGAWSSLLNLESSQIAIPEVKPIRGQMASFHTAKRLFHHVVYSPRGYIVPRKGGKILAGATVEKVGFDNSTTEAGIESVSDCAREISPSLSNLPIDETWSGLRPMAFDRRPIMGLAANTDNLFVATAHYRNGILLAPMTARILADKILHKSDSKYLALWRPDRFSSSRCNLET